MRKSSNNMTHSQADNNQHRNAGKSRNHEAPRTRSEAARERPRDEMGRFESKAENSTHRKSMK